MSIDIQRLRTVGELLDEIKALRKAWTEAESDNNILRAEIENTRAEPVRKVKLPERHYRSYTMMPDENGRWLDRDDVIAALKAANVEIEP